MICFLSGTIHRKESKALLLNVQGVGYRVWCPLSVVGEAREKDSFFLYTHHHIREDDQSLFGFLKARDLQFFQKLISVSGIGPRTALDILEVPSHMINDAIETGDVAFLKTLKGIGKKTAERMILELRGNLPDLEQTDENSISPEVLQALSDLGFERKKIHETFKARPASLSSPEEMVKWFLQQMG